MASRSSAVTVAEGDEFWDFAARGLGAGVEDGTGLGAVAGGVAAVGGALAAGVGADVVALGALAAAGAGVAAAFPAVAAGRATVLRTGADFLVTGVVLTSWPDGSTVFLTTGFLGATGTAGAFWVVVFLVKILLSSAMGDQTPPNYDARPVSG